MQFIGQKARILIFHTYDFVYVQFKASILISSDD